MRPNHSLSKTLLWPVCAALLVNLALWRGFVSLESFPTIPETAIAVETDFRPLPSVVAAPRPRAAFQARHRSGSHDQAHTAPLAHQRREFITQARNTSPRLSAGHSMARVQERADHLRLNPALVPALTASATPSSPAVPEPVDTGIPTTTAPAAKNVPSDGGAVQAPEASQDDLRPHPLAASPHGGPTHGARILRQSQPPYPPAVRRDGVEGAVLLRVILDANAKMQCVEIASSSGDPRLDEAAREEISHWEFAPRMEDGIAVAATLRVRVIFTLEDSP